MNECSFRLGLDAPLNNRVSQRRRKIRIKVRRRRDRGKNWLKMSARGGKNLRKLRGIPSLLVRMWSSWTFDPRVDERKDVHGLSFLVIEFLKKVEIYEQMVDLEAKKTERSQVRTNRRSPFFCFWYEELKKKIRKLFFSFPLRPQSQVNM